MKSGEERNKAFHSRGEAAAASASRVDGLIDGRSCANQAAFWICGTTGGTAGGGGATGFAAGPDMADISGAIAIVGAMVISGAGGAGGFGGVNKAAPL